MRLPFERYILALMADRVCGPNLKKTLLSRGLLVPSLQDILRLEKFLLKGCSRALAGSLADPKRRMNKDYKRKLLRRIRLLDLQAYFDSRSSYPETEKILLNRNVRLLLEVLIMGGFPPTEMTTLLRGRFDVDIPEACIQLYRHYFFDPGNMDGPSWTYYIAQLRDPNEAALKAAVLKNPENLAYIKWKAGLEVDVDYTVMLRRLMTDSFFRLMETMAKPVQDMNKIVQLGFLFMKAGDRIEKFGRPDELDELGELEAKFRVLEKEHVQQSRLPNMGALPPIGESKPSLIVLPQQKFEQKKGTGE